MSAEKPEVGDVWEDSKGMVHISRIFTLSDDTRAIVFIDNNNNTVLEDSAREEHFIKMFTYSGKSKASVNDLFQTEQNVANNVAKPDLQHLKAKNDTQTDLRTIGELQAEINRLREENAKMFELLEMVARGITLMCDTEDVIRITSAVKKFCIAKRESEE